MPEAMLRPVLSRLISSSALVPIFGLHFAVEDLAMVFPVKETSARKPRFGLFKPSSMPSRTPITSGAIGGREASGWVRRTADFPEPTPFTSAR